MNNIKPIHRLRSMVKDLSENITDEELNEIDSDNKLCYCGKPIDTTNPDCVMYDLCEEHQFDV
jgi:hypothetical protein